MSPLFSRLNKPNPFNHSSGQVLQHSAHLGGPLLDHLQFVNVSLELGEPKLGAVFQPWPNEWNNPVDPLAVLLLVQSRTHFASTEGAHCFFIFSLLSTRSFPADHLVLLLATVPSQIQDFKYLFLKYYAISCWLSFRLSESLNHYPLRSAI